MIRIQILIFTMLSLFIVNLTTLAQGIVSRHEKTEPSLSATNVTSGYENGHEWVDLELPSGTKWATCNIGASSPTDYGNYYAWGELSIKKRYIAGNSLTSCISLEDIAGNTNYDVANYMWGASWCMPNLSDYKELLINCEYKWTMNNGVYGYIFTSKKNSKSIFLPAAGYVFDTSYFSIGEKGIYWVSSPYDGELPYEGDLVTKYAWAIFFNSDNFYEDRNERSGGRSVRPVLK
ncbi:MAG: hypothetical protein LIP09_15800 [Bacteroidales bacterium]|nr:hypothetical protein [Bacteroidales bacterium]